MAILKFPRSNGSSGAVSRRSRTNVFRTSVTSRSISRPAPQSWNGCRAADSRKRWRRAFTLAAVAVALAAAAALGALTSARLRSEARARGSASGQPPHHLCRLRGVSVDLTGREDGGVHRVVRAATGRSSSAISMAGRPLPITSDDADHQSPRWLPDASALIYFSPAATGQVQGAIYRIATLGGSFQRITGSIGGGDVSREQRLASFRLENERIQLVTSTLDGWRMSTSSRQWRPGTTGIRDGLPMDTGSRSRRATATDGTCTTSRPPAVLQSALTDDNRFMEGLTWLPDSSGIIYASTRGSTVPYLAPLTLWQVVAGRQPGASTHARRGLLRAARRARERPRDCLEPGDAVRHLEIRIRARRW